MNDRLLDTTTMLSFDGGASVSVGRSLGNAFDRGGWRKACLLRGGGLVVGAMALLAASAGAQERSFAGGGGGSVQPPRPQFQQGGRGSSFSGIGQVGSNIDLLGYPARDRVFATPLPTVTSGGGWCGPRRDCGQGPRANYNYVAPRLPAYEGGRSYVGERSYGGGSGLSVNGAYRDDRFKVGFSLNSGSSNGFGAGVGGGFGGGFGEVRDVNDFCGTPPRGDGCDDRPAYCVYPSPYYGGYYYPTYVSGLSYGYRGVYRSGSYYGTPYAPAFGPSSYGWDPQLMPGGVAPTAPAASDGGAGTGDSTFVAPTRREMGMYALAGGKPAAAVQAFRADMKEQGPSTLTLRLLALSLAMDRKWDAAQEAIASAYQLDPRLGEVALDISSLGFQRASFRGLVGRAVMNANREKSASAWLLVAALMQAEGRGELAFTMAQRAKSLGLDSQAADSFAALSGAAGGGTVVSEPKK